MCAFEAITMKTQTGRIILYKEIKMLKEILGQDGGKRW